MIWRFKICESTIERYPRAIDDDLATRGDEDRLAGRGALTNLANIDRGELGGSEYLASVDKVEDGWVFIGENALGIDARKPRLSWRICARVRWCSGMSRMHR
jgi:hypothetical protein